MLGTLAPVTQNGRLIDPQDCRRIIAACDRDMVPCTRDECTTLVAELIGCYPDIQQKMAYSRNVDTVIYVAKMNEAMAQFSWAIGKAIVNGGTGLPAKNPYKPKPADIVSFGEAELAKRQNVKTMAQRHLAEAARREKEAADEQRYQDLARTPEERRAAVARIMQTFRKSADSLA